MHKYLFVFIICFGACQVEKSIQDQEDTREDRITEQEIEIVKDLVQGVFDEVWGGLDSTKILNYHTDDFIILEHGQIWDNNRIKQNIRESLANSNEAVRINKMDYISIKKYGPSIQLAYNNHADFVVQDSIVSKGNWLESALAVPTKDGWKLKMMHSTWIGNK